MAASGSRVRNFVFTLNNYTHEQEDVLQNHLGFKYLVYGREVAPTTMTRHLQGYCELKTQKRWSNLKLMLPWHIEPRKGTPVQAAEYCKKGGDFVEFGIISQQGKRSDIDLVRGICDDEEARPLSRVAAETASYQAFRHAQVYLSYNERRRTWKPTVYWYYGPTGTGKTRKAMEKFPNAWISGKNLRWWYDYDAHEDVIIDDFRKDFCTFHELLRILDRYPYTIETKGGHRQLLAENIVITCPYHPELVYGTREDVSQLMRRIDHIEVFTSEEI